MADIIHLRGSAHEEAQRLLPWLVNGTLAADEVALVEDHVAECPECRTELQEEREFAQAFASMPVDVDSSWSGIEQRLETERSVAIGPAAWWRRKVPLAWAVASPLAAAAAIALVFVNVTPTQPVNQQYRALGTPAVVRSANVIVLFESNSRESDMRAALSAANARLVDGPTDTGAYLLLVEGSKREQALKSLRDNDAIALAEPIDGPNHE